MPPLWHVEAIGGVHPINLSTHKAGAVRDLLQRSGFSYRYLPSYSPDLNPIELAWAKIKGQLRKDAARTQKALHAALSSALDAITAQDTQGFFKAAYASV